MFNGVLLVAIIATWVMICVNDLYSFALFILK